MASLTVIPSKTNSGELVAPPKEPTPSKRIFESPEGSPELIDTCKPATFPCKASTTFPDGR